MATVLYVSVALVSIKKQTHGVISYIGNKFHEQIIWALLECTKPHHTFCNVSTPTGLLQAMQEYGGLCQCISYLLLYKLACQWCHYVLSTVKPTTRMPVYLCQNLYDNNWKLSNSYTWGSHPHVHNSMHSVSPVQLLSQQTWRLLIYTAFI